MQKSNIKRNLILFVITVLFAAAMCLFVTMPMRSASAEGNNSGSTASANAVTIKLDVNGLDSVNEDGSVLDNNQANLESNNNKHYGVRHIYADALAQSLGSSSSGFSFDDNIINSSSSFTAVKAAGTNNVIDITAKQINTDGGYFSVAMSRTGGEKLTVDVKVIVEDTFVQASANRGKTIYVGYPLKASDPSKENPESGSFNDEVHASLVTFDNFSTVELDLGEYLVGRALYADDTKVLGSNGNFWTVNSVQNLTIKEVRFDDGTGTIFQSIVYANPTSSTRINPRVTFDVHITSFTVIDYSEAYRKDFFDVTHNMLLKLGEVSNSAAEYTICIPVKFTPKNPQPKSIKSDSSVWQLNVISEYTRVLNNTLRDNQPQSSYKFFESGDPADTKPNDYRAIVVTPEDLVDYAKSETAGDSINMYFDTDGTAINGSSSLSVSGCRIEVYGAKDGETITRPTQYIIIADKGTTANSSYTINFSIAYDGSSARIPIELALKVYGGYSIKFPTLEGKKPVTYNYRTSSIFSDIRSHGYMLKSVVSNDENVLIASFANNEIKLDPQVENINGRANTTVKLTFVNDKNQEITFDSETVNINVNAGSIFARFDDWQAWLIIVACIIGGLLIILLIVWLFIHSISKHKQAELAMQAPVSSYIVKLNSSIAATQAQQRMVQTQSLTQASTMLLGAGPTGTAAPNPDTLQLAGGVPYSTSTPSTPSTPLMSEPQATIPPDSGEDLYALIAKYITDEELLERIFTEKYEPKGMVRRTFFKSKDLQARELEKEKKRIIERYKSPMPMDEAVMSENDNKKVETSTPMMSEPQAAEPQDTVNVFVLDFDPDSPLYVEEEKPLDEFSEEKIDIDASPEEAHLKDVERRHEILVKELAELKTRIGKVENELSKAKSLEEELREKIAKAEADDEQYGKDIEALEFSLASAKNKDKERITRDIGIKEEKKQRNLAELERLRKELETLLGNSDNLSGVSAKLNEIEVQKNAALESIVSEQEKAKTEYAAYKERLAKVQARQALEAKINSLSPLLVDVNKSDYEMRKLQEEVDKQDKEREALKGAVAAAKSQILGATDFDVINDLNTQISDANARLSELEKETVKATKRKSELNIDFNAQRRKANDFIEKNDIPLEDVIDAENIVLGNMEFDVVKAQREGYKLEAEKAVADAQAVYDDLNAASDDITFIAMEVAANVKGIEEEIEAAQAELDAINQQMENASDDERLLLIVDQGDKSDKLDELKAKLEQENINGTKRKMEAQAEHDEKLEAARKALAEANETFEKACASYDDLINNTNPIDLIMSGCGIISQDQKKREAENLKKQLERSKNEIEQARLAAQMAQMEAEQARVDAARASEEARAEAERAALEAERNAQEAIERAEQARIEAEEKARAEVEEAERKKREAEEALAAEAEEAKRKAQEEAEEAQRKALEDAEEAKRAALEETEEAKRIALEETEEAKRKAMEESEEAQRKAMEEVEEAKRKAQEEIEEMRRKSEEEAEAKRLEEENKRKEEEARQKAENERNANIAKKIAMRKEQIVAIRNEMKELKGDEDAKNLRERLYNIQLTYDEDEHGSTELMDFYNKTMDDIQNNGEIARLKAENAKKPQRVVRKVTERVNRIAKHKPTSKNGAHGAARPASKSGARPAARPASKSGARPAARPGARPAARPAARPGARPAARPTGTRPSSGTRPTRPKR